MYAIIETGGKQYRVEPGMVLDVEKLEAEESKVVFDRVLLVSDGKKFSVGTPTVDATVTAQVLDEVKGDKVLAFKKKKRKDWKWARGHRQNYTRVRIDEIVAR